MTTPRNLRELVHAYDAKEPRPVRYRPASWPAGPTSAWLEDETRHVRLAERGEPGDRLIDAGSLRTVCSRLDESSDSELLAAFGLVMAWGSGTSAPRSYRNLAAATADKRLVPTLRETLSLCRHNDAGRLEQAYRSWQVAGVGRSYFTKWFAFAGRAEARPWQPLILDDRVLQTMNITLGVTTRELAGTRRLAKRYRAYVEALHSWSAELGGRATPERLEWIMFCHNGEPSLEKTSSRC